LPPNVLQDQVGDYWNPRILKRIPGELVGRGLRSRGAPIIDASLISGIVPELEMGPAHNVSEIGVDLGADHVEWARSRPWSLAGVDSTLRAIESAQSRLRLGGLTSGLRCVAV
jgi:hypothetical protein